MKKAGNLQRLQALPSKDTQKEGTIMGYYGHFDFDCKILAVNTEQAEAALLAHIIDRSTEAPRWDSLDWILQQAPDRKIVSLFNAAWGEDLAEEQTPAPLIALANLSTRGDIVILGDCEKKWHTYEENLLDVLAPFIEDGGTIAYKGQDFECAQKWVFEDGIREEPLNDVYDRSTVEETAEAFHVAQNLLKIASTLLGEDHEFSKKTQTFLSNYQHLTLTEK